MKPFCLAALAAIGLARTSYAQVAPEESALLITAVFDGPLPGGQPKGLELYAIRDVPDLRRYGLQSINTAAEAAERPEVGWLFPEGSSAERGEFLYVVNRRPAFADYTGLEAKYGSVEVSFNGDDAVALFLDSVVVDRFGHAPQAGDTTALGWQYLDGFAYRRDAVPASGDGFAESNFSYSGSHALKACGGETNATCEAEIPFGSYALTTLPVELTAFRAEPSPEGALLTWSTASETDNDYFEVELSRDGQAFSAIGQVAGHGTSSTTTDYTFTYPTAATGWHYFRLRQVDRDGQAAYSGIDSAELGRQAVGISIVRQGPDYLHVRSEGAGPLYVVNSAGAAVGRLNGPPGDARELALGGLVPGVYVVTDFAHYQRFVVPE